ncbi:MAG: N-6 DNA methylase [Thermodesulfovibrionales bacterium]
MANEKEHWQLNTEKLARDIKEASLRANTEEDLKMRLEPMLQAAFKEMGIDVSIVKYEKTATSFGGKADAVYGHLTIEYKAPGRLSDKTAARKASEQLQRYLSEQGAELGQHKDYFIEKAVGIAIDGKNILFVRYTKAPSRLQTPLMIEEKEFSLFDEFESVQGFHVMGPYPVTPASIGSLLIFVRASARRPLTARELAAVFSPSCRITQQTISQLYSEVVKAQRRHVPSRVKTFYTEWDRIFGVVYGQETEKAEQSAEETAGFYQMSTGAKLKPLLFSIHTFYAFLMKLLSIELVALQREASVEPFVKGLGAFDDEKLFAKLSHLESGGEFIERGISNFLEADFFSWYLDIWNPSIAEIFRNIARTLSEFEPATPILEPEWTRDLLQELYEVIVPKKLRHDLGEYYTPDWLAGYVVRKSGFQGTIGERFLDPSCGSGTFLVQAINKTIRSAEGQKKFRTSEIAKHILDNIAGFDLNPLAVLAARTNYLIAFSKFIPFVRPISIPVYLCDSVLAPSRYMEEGDLPLEDTVVFTTTKGDYVFPASMQGKDMIDTFTAMIDEGLRAKMTPENFERRIGREFSPLNDEKELLSRVYRKIKELDDSGENGIWAKYIKNAFAPVYLGAFDFVVGNPPWIRWGYLSDDYRKRTLKLWHRYGIFSLKGHETRLGAGEKDFSMLFTYACADNYLKAGGILAFVITMEVFKSKGAGEGFRQFQLKNKDIPLKIMGMEDMVDLKPFQAANKTAIFFMEKGERTKYPVPVLEWKRKKGIGRIPPHWAFEQVVEKCAVKKAKAVPVNPQKPASSWQTATSLDLCRYIPMKGKSAYRAYQGVDTQPYGVFCLSVKEVRPDGQIVVENMHERGKWKLKSTSQSIEPDLIFPAVSGGQIIKFGIKQPFFILVSQDPGKREPYAEEWMIDNVPLTHAYLTQFRDVLLSRKSKVLKELSKNTAFYAMYAVGEYTFAKYRVAWKFMASKINAVVLSKVRTPFGTKPLLPTKTTAFFSTNKREEAHFLCALLNAPTVDNFIKSFSAAGRGFGSPSIMNNVAIPQFDPNNTIHARLVELSEEAHRLVTRGDTIENIEDEIDSLAKRLWNIE